MLSDDNKSQRAFIKNVYNIPIDYWASKITLFDGPLYKTTRALDGPERGPSRAVA